MRWGCASASGPAQTQKKLGQNILPLNSRLVRSAVGARYQSLCPRWMVGMCCCCNLGINGSEWSRPVWKDGARACFSTLDGRWALLPRTTHPTFRSTARVRPSPLPPCSFPNLSDPPPPPSPPSDAIALLVEYGRNELAEKKKSKLKILGKLLISPMAIALWIAIIVELGRLVDGGGVGE